MPAPNPHTITPLAISAPPRGTTPASPTPFSVPSCLRASVPIPTSTPAPPSIPRSLDPSIPCPLSHLLYDLTDGGLHIDQLAEEHHLSLVELARLADTPDFKSAAHAFNSLLKLRAELIASNARANALQTLDEFCTERSREVRPEVHRKAAADLLRATKPPARRASTPRISHHPRAPRASSSPNPHSPPAPMQTTAALPALPHLLRLLLSCLTAPARVAARAAARSCC